MKIMDLLDDVFSESVEISPVLARISPALAQRKSPETGHLSPISPFSPTPTDIPIKSEKKNDPGRTWAPNNPFLCHCGFSTGWQRDGKPLCPACDGKPPAGMPEGPRLNDVDPGIPSTGPCLICGLPLDQDGGECWHRAFHMQAVKPPPEAAKAPTIIEQARANISRVALSWLRENKADLRRHGWRPSELWRRNKSKGICWCSIWGMPGLSVVIETSGCLTFHFIDSGRHLKQTAWPKLNQKRSPYYERHK